MKNLTAKEKKAYVKSKGTKCPYCESKDLFSDNVNCDGAVGWADIQCDKCHRQWVDKWELTGVEEVDEDE